MNYLHYFNVETERSEERFGNYSEPWVSYTEETDKVEYDKTQRDILAETPLTFEILENGSLYFNNLNGRTVQYSKNAGDWNTVENGTLEVEEGDEIQLKGNITSGSPSTKISASARFIAKGNLASLVFGDDFKDSCLSTFKNLQYLFEGCTAITSAEKMIIPSCSAYYVFSCLFKDCTNLVYPPEIVGDNSFTGSAFYSMFLNCTSLIKAPKLPSKKVYSSAYYQMFRGCTSLIDAPDLPATEISGQCYESMFSACTSLRRAPELPATNLTYRCYFQMFEGCTSLEIGPSILPALDLSAIDNSYTLMFHSCTSLKTAPELPATILGNRCYFRMFDSCTSLINVQSTLPAINLESECYAYMFYACQSLEKAPEINATTFASRSFESMFQGCTSLETPPSVLRASVLPSSCCAAMFKSCKSLKTAPEIQATSFGGSGSCWQMFYFCPSLKVAPVLKPETLIRGCYDSMFYSCTTLNYIKCLALDGIGNTTYTSQWVAYGPSGNTGTFVRNPQATWTIAYNNNAVPKGWTVVNDE